ncbi:MAG: YHYH protein [Devosiaceae bacterium]|nr:YHYH protein [Devosiaceae bacterium MH13]
MATQIQPQPAADPSVQKPTRTSAWKRVGLAAMVGVLLATTALPTGGWAHGGHDEEVAATGAALVEDDASWVDTLLEELLLGSVEAAASVSVTSDGALRIITADGLPDHSTGASPNSGNPHTITTQSYRFQLAMEPSVTGGTVSTDRYVFGVALNGVIFDPATAEFWNNDRSSGWNYEAFGTQSRDLGLDTSNAHVQPNGAYHYHGIPEALLDRLEEAGEPTLLGYAADGFPIYGPLGYADADDPSSGLAELEASYAILSGTRPSGPGGTYDGTFTEDWAYVAGSGDLDACNGRTGVTAEYPDGTYYYVITDEFPYVPRCFVGTPDESFAKQSVRGTSQARQRPGAQRGERPHRPGQRQLGFRRPPPPRG